MRRTSILSHLISIIVLPGTMAVLIPYLLFLYIPNPEITGNYNLLTYAGAVILTTGGLLFLWSVISFIIYGKGTLAPWAPPKELVVSGPYSYVRNPMILGVILIITGEALILNMISILIWAMFFFVLNTLYFELVEEPRLERKYGESYVKYCRKIKRWMPRLSPYKAAAKN